jgi:hypothetical protein
MLRSNINAAAFTKMTNDARPLCLLCGRAMNITESNRADIDLICFERQKLECPNCGGHDSRFAFIPEKAFSPNAILPVAANRAEQPPPQFQFAASQPVESHPVDPQSGESQFLESVGSKSLESQAVKPRDVSPAKNISDRIQSYMAKWRGP